MIHKNSLIAFSLGVAMTLLATSIGSAGRICAGDASEAGVEELAAANWMHVGCISLGGVCYDVFQDNSGDLWVCKRCNQTGNPSPGKCRRLSQYEIDNNPWCS
jgi:hypothetical protein